MAVAISPRTGTVASQNLAARYGRIALKVERLKQQNRELRRELTRYQRWSRRAPADGD